MVDVAIAIGNPSFVALLRTPVFKLKKETYYLYQYFDEYYLQGCVRATYQLFYAQVIIICQGTPRSQ